MKAFFPLAALIMLVPATGFGQEMNHHHHQMSQGNQAIAATEALPKEPGEAAFAAIQEIVAMLEADPATDWSKVNIEALRQHLIDMSNVTLGAVVKAEQLGESMRFAVSGDSRVRGSIRRMVMAHAATMNGVEGWKFAAETSSSGAVLTVTPPDQSSMVKLKALGFIGILTLGMHHQQHHWMLATGMNPQQ
jgi:hypothetical protein